MITWMLQQILMHFNNVMLSARLMKDTPSPPLLLDEDTD